MLTVDCYDGDEQYNTRMTKMKQNFLRIQLASRNYYDDGNAQALTSNNMVLTTEQVQWAVVEYKILVICLFIKQW